MPETFGGRTQARTGYLAKVSDSGNPHRRGQMHQTRGARRFVPKSVSGEEAMISAIKYFSGAAVVVLGFANCLAWADAKNMAAAEPAPTKVVAYGDLNLDSDTGVKTLYARLRAASRDVCVGLEGTDVMEQRIVRARCYSAALSGSVAKVNNAALTILYNRSPAG